MHTLIINKNIMILGRRALCRRQMSLKCDQYDQKLLRPEFLGGDCATTYRSKQCSGQGGYTVPTSSR